MARTTRDLCQDCWQDANPTEYAPVATRYGPCSACGAEALVTRSARFVCGCPVCHCTRLAAATPFAGYGSWCGACAAGEHATLRERWSATPCKGPTGVHSLYDGAAGGLVCVWCHYGD